jgi:hypothetical protein
MWSLRLRHREYSAGPALALASDLGSTHAKASEKVRRQMNQAIFGQILVEAPPVGAGIVVFASTLFGAQVNGDLNGHRGVGNQQGAGKLPIGGEVSGLSLQTGGLIVEFGLGESLADVDAESPREL